MWWSRGVLLTVNMKYKYSTSFYHVCCDQPRGCVSNTHRSAGCGILYKVVGTTLYESLSGIEMKYVTTTYLFTTSRQKIQKQEGQVTSSKADH
jgi:hypothetical protein